MKKLKKICCLLLTPLVIVGCSVDEEKAAQNKPTEETKKDNQIEKNSKEENNPNDEKNINNTKVEVDKQQTEEQSKKVSAAQNNNKEKKVRLNVKPQIQEVWNYCAPTTVSMMLSTQGVHVDQYKLAKEMGTYEPFGTHNKDAVRVLNKHMFGYEVPVANQAGYRIETVVGGAKSNEEVALFKKRLKKNIDDGYPVYLTMDVSKIYPGLKGEHNVAAIGYIEDENGNINQLYYLDPAPRVQDKVYGGLKIETPEKILNSMLTCEEPNYAW